MGSKMREKRILLVEDEATNREILTYALREEGYVVDAVVSAGAAMLCLELTAYAPVIADWLLPDGNGADISLASSRQSRWCTISITLWVNTDAIAGDRRLWPPPECGCNTR